MDIHNTFLTLCLVVSMSYALFALLTTLLPSSWLNKASDRVDVSIEGYCMRLLTFIDWVIGPEEVRDNEGEVTPPRWTRRLVVLSLFYWIALSSIMATLQAPGLEIRNTLLTLVALHVWAWSNVLTDYFTFRVTRYNVHRFLAFRSEHSKGTKWSPLWRIVAVEVGAASLFLYLAAFGTSVANLFFIHQDVGAVLGNLDDAFRLAGTFESYSVVVGGEAKLQLAGKFTAVITSFLPTMLFVFYLLFWLIGRVDSAWLRSGFSVGSFFAALGVAVACVIGLKPTKAEEDKRLHEQYGMLSRQLEQIERRLKNE